MGSSIEEISVNGKFEGQGVYTYIGGGTLSGVWRQGQFVPNKIQ